ncbi:hypothetical protein [Arthrobacter sp. zg-Y1110]|uniref:hypothetical protein n=1 Tax=Arthrobacter sp. zg-Y1110 TaxID=2886932 RepID=UPI001D13B256|nr:hypothetical protein [Arthrobacter sp. zg-Y1110]MCC3292282.1 hypothetical protein [Arthrobacter sp. zg-Y1110]UWX85364.1 hypothetical protein N2K99_02000 [Arthrobacter sp. zg-Y1110]
MIGLTASFSRRARICALVLASAALLTACGADKAAEPATSKSATATPSTSATPSATASATTPAATPSATPAPTETPVPEPAAPVIVTTPNGLHSFTLPAGWSAVPTEPLPMLAHSVGLSPAAFNILDSTGNPVAKFESGADLHNISVISPGHIMYDVQELPGYTNKVGEPVYFQFESRPTYAAPGSPSRGYYVQLEDDGLPDADGMDGGNAYGTVFMSDGDIRFEALIDPGAFADDAAARAWMQTDIYQQLKAMMLSLTYNG